MKSKFLKLTFLLVIFFENNCYPQFDSIKYLSSDSLNFVYENIKVSFEAINHKKYSVLNLNIKNLDDSIVTSSYCFLEKGYVINDGYYSHDTIDFAKGIMLIWKSEIRIASDFIHGPEEFLLSNSKKKMILKWNLKKEKYFYVQRLYNNRTQKGIKIIIELYPNTIRKKNKVSYSIKALEKFYD